MPRSLLAVPKKVYPPSAGASQPSPPPKVASGASTAARETYGSINSATQAQTSALFICPHPNRDQHGGWPPPPISIYPAFFGAANNIMKFQSQPSIPRPSLAP